MVIFSSAKAAPNSAGNSVSDGTLDVIFSVITLYLNIQSNICIIKYPEFYLNEANYAVKNAW